MNRRRSLVTLLAFSTIPAFALANPEATAAAQAATTAWLKKLDASDYSGTWETAASIFKSAVSSNSWQQGSQSARAPLGPLSKRKDKSATFSRTLPGAPDGQYVVIQYDTEFKNKANAVETITVAQDQDGAWRVAGYFIR